MDTHLRIAAVLHIGLGILGLTAGFIILLGASFASLLVGFVAPPSDAMIASPIIAVVGFLISGLTMIVPLFGIMAGVGIYKQTQWGRILGIVVSILYLPVHFPFGAILGIYTLWVLLSPESVYFIKKTCST